MTWRNEGQFCWISETIQSNGLLRCQIDWDGMYLFNAYLRDYRGRTSFGPWSYDSIGSFRSLDEAKQHCEITLAKELL